MYERFVAAVALGVCVLLLGGCAAAPESPYRDDFVAAEKANKDNPFVRQVFADALSTGVIKAADYNESRRRLQNCYEDIGLQVDSFPDNYGLGLKYFGFLVEEFTPQADEAVQACNQKYDGSANHTISDLYYQQLSNPQKQDMDQLIADCFVRKGLTPKGFDAQDYREFLDKNSAKCADGKCVLPDGSEADADNLPSKIGDKILPGGKSADTLEADTCRNAPLKDFRGEP